MDLAEVDGRDNIGDLLLLLLVKVVVENQLWGGVGGLFILFYFNLLGETCGKLLLVEYKVEQAKWDRKFEL